MIGDHDRSWVDWRALRKARSPGRAWDSLSWLSIRALAASVNDVIAKRSPELVDALRQRWVEQTAPALAADGRCDADLAVPMPGATSFLVLGDTGEQDASQYAVVPALAAQEDVAFAVICSDVIYPAGDVNDYVDGFYHPYERVTAPIFALPGNHDWYDGLNGFMWHFCDQPALPAEAYRPPSGGLIPKLARLLWRKPSKPDFDLLAPRRAARAPVGEPWKPRQPGPYYAIDTPDLLLVCVDTGVTGRLDPEQGAWLERISARDKDKILLTGKPLMVDHRHEPGVIVGGKKTVDEIVRAPAHRYVAAIGGDIHNYQRYSARLADGRPLHYLVAGGGGAFMSATHPIAPGLDVRPAKRDAESLDGLTVEDVAYHPKRADSLRFYSCLLVPRLWRLARGLAAAVLSATATTAVLLVADPGDAARETALAGGALALGAWLSAVWLGVGRPSRDQVARWRRVVSLAAAALAGAVLALAEWWLVREDFALVAATMLVLGAFGATVAWRLRVTGWWRRPRGAVLAVVAQALVLVGATIWLLVRIDPAGGWGRIALTVAGTVAAVVAAPFFVDRVQQWAPRADRIIVLAVALAAAGGLVALDRTGSGVPEAAVAGLVTLTALVFGVVVWHLHFLGAFGLLWRRDERSGRLSPQEAEDALAWRASETGPPLAPRVRHILDLVHPGSRNPNGPIQGKVSEIFDRDEPPFFKSFLRLDVHDGVLTIRAFGVTGQETRLEDVEQVDQIRVALGVRPPAGQV